jgi:protein gp37
MSDTKIEWCTKVWNPVSGCTPISTGCDNCYAKRIAEKCFAGQFGYSADEPFRPTIHDNKIDEPLSWKTPQHIFVSSMGDLFHNDFFVEPAIYNKIKNIINRCPQHKFYFLTKRPGTMQKIVSNYFNCNEKILPNLWIGVTAETQKIADYRIPVLLKTPAAGRFVSVEPMLEPVNLTKFLKGRNKLNWVICGAETGDNARPMQIDWALDLQIQCTYYNTMFFFKKDSSGRNTLKNQVIREIPQSQCQQPLLLLQEGNN